MAITDISSVSAQPSTDKVSSRGENLDRADFLRMLVAQLGNQDPLNPMQGQEFASQLAQFSSLQELQKMSGSLDQSIQGNLLLSQSINNTMAASLIGKSVKAEVNQLNIGSAGDVSLQYNLSGAATDITVDIKNANGETVRTIKVNPQMAGDQSLTWDGKDDNGVRVVNGDYTFTVNANAADGSSVSAMSFIQGRVEGVNYENGVVMLMVNGTQINLNQVLSIGESSQTVKG